MQKVLSMYTHTYTVCIYRRSRELEWYLFQREVMKVSEDVAAACVVSCDWWN